MGKQDLIFSRNTNGGFLSYADALDRAPAMLTQTAAPDRSSRYGHLSTADAVQILDGYGYGITAAAQVKGRTIEANKYGQHMVSFAKRDGYTEAGEFSAELILYNSHDGNSSLKLFAGCFRFICSNGLVSGDGMQQALRHSKSNSATFSEMVEGMADELPRLADRIMQLKAATLSEAAINDFADNAARLRWQHINDAETVETETGDRQIKKGLYCTNDTAQAVGMVRRYQDNGSNAWLAFNRIQENIIGGGAPVLSFTDRNEHGAERKARRVSSIKDNVKINRRLWDMAENYAGIAA